MREDPAKRKVDGEEGREVQCLLPAAPPDRRTWSTASGRPGVGRMAARQSARDPAGRHPAWAYQAAVMSYLTSALERVRDKPCSAQEAEEASRVLLTAWSVETWNAEEDVPLRAWILSRLRSFIHAMVRQGRGSWRRLCVEAHTAAIPDDDALGGAPPVDEASVAAFNCTWAGVVLGQVRERLRRDHARYTVVVEDLIRTDGIGSPDMAERLRVRRVQWALLRHRAKQKFLRLFGEELWATVGYEDQFRNEWRTLWPYFP